MSDHTEIERREIWQDVEGTAGVYRVSTHGRVLSLQQSDERFIGSLTADGYTAVSYVDASGAKIDSHAHVMVMEAFVGPRQPGMQVRHLDSDPTNNRLDNLTWGTQSENYQDRVAAGTGIEGANNCAAKLSHSEVQEIRQRVSETQRDLAEEYGVSPSSISRVVNDLSWAAGCPTKKVIGLKKAQVEEIRANPEVKQRVWVAKFGVSQATISRAKRGLTWKP